MKDFTGPNGELIQVARKNPETVVVDGKSYQAVELSRDKGFDFNFSDSLVEISDSPWNYIQFSLTEDKINHSVSFSAISPDRSYQLKKEFRFIRMKIILNFPFPS